MPCLLKTIHNSGHYHAGTHPRIPHCARDNPGIIAKDPQDAAFIALMVLFFALLGTAIALIAVYCSRRKLDRECAQEGPIQLAAIPPPSKTDTMPSTASTRGSSTRSVTKDRAEPEYPRFHKTTPRQGPTIRGRRNMPELRFGNRKEVRLQAEDGGGEPSPMPSLPEPAFRSAPRAVFPGTRYGMGQLGNDGNVHRPESIFEYVRP